MIWWPEDIPTLKLGSTTLRPIVPEDAEDVFKGCQDPEIPKFTTIPSPYSMDLALAFTGKHALERHANLSEFIFAVEDSSLKISGIYKNSDDSEVSTSSNDYKTSEVAISSIHSNFAGVISLHTIDLANHRAEIGYWLNKESRGHGIGTSAVKLITEYGLMIMGFQRIYGLVDTRNEASKRILLKAGYEYEGTLKKHVTRGDGNQIDMALFAITRH